LQCRKNYSKTVAITYHLAFTVARVGPHQSLGNHLEKISQTKYIWGNTCLHCQRIIRQCERARQMRGKSETEREVGGKKGLYSVSAVHWTAWQPQANRKWNNNINYWWIFKDTAIQGCHVIPGNSPLNIQCQYSYAWHCVLRQFRIALCPICISIKALKWY